MKINQTYQFSDEEIKMLNNPLPYNPCEYCGGKEYCCGCQKEREYFHKITKYKELGIYDIACNIQEARHIQASIRDFKNKISSLQTELEVVKGCIPQEVWEEVKINA